MQRLLSLALVSLVTGIICNARASDKISLHAILELPFEDTVTVPPERVIEECTAFLKKRDSLSTEQVAAALRQRARAYGVSKKTEEAEKDIDDLCKILPRDCCAHCMRAGLLRGTNRLKESLEESKEAVRLEPASPLAWYEVAATLYEQDRFGASLAVLDKTLTLDPKFAPAHHLRGLIYSRSDPMKCIESMNRYLELNPFPHAFQPESPYFCKGMSLLRLNRPKEALPTLLMGHKLNPSNWETSRELAIAYGDLGQFHLAAFYAGECVRLDVSDPNGFSYSAKFLHRIGKTKESLQMLERLVAMKDAPASEIAGTYQELGKFTDALRFYDKALDADSNQYLSLLGKASILATCPDASIRNGQEAVKLAKRSLERKNTRDWQKWEPSMILAESYAELGEFDEAIHYAKKALEIAGPEFGRRREFQEKLELFVIGRPYRSGAK
jgi:tetratricopeptide (TPR) repeat protein